MHEARPAVRARVEGDAAGAHPGVLLRGGREDHLRRRAEQAPAIHQALPGREEGLRGGPAHTRERGLHDPRREPPRVRGLRPGGRLRGHLRRQGADARAPAQRPGRTGSLRHPRGHRGREAAQDPGPGLRQVQGRQDRRHRPRAPPHLLWRVPAAHAPQPGPLPPPRAERRGAGPQRRRRPPEWPARRRRDRRHARLGLLPAPVLHRPRLRGRVRGQHDSGHGSQGRSRGPRHGGVRQRVRGGARSRAEADPGHRRRRASRRCPRGLPEGEGASAEDHHLLVGRGPGVPPRRRSRRHGDGPRSRDQARGGAGDRGRLLGGQRTVLDRAPGARRDLRGRRPT